MMGMGAGPILPGRISSHPNLSFDPSEKSLEVVLATEISSAVVRHDEKSTTSTRIDDWHLGPPLARSVVTVLPSFVQHASPEVVLLPTNMSKDVCLVGFGLVCLIEVNCSFLFPPRPEVSLVVA